MHEGVRRAYTIPEQHAAGVDIGRSGTASVREPKDNTPAIFI